MFRRSKSHQHVSFVDPEEATREALGWFLRYRGIAIQAALEVGIISLITYLAQNAWILLGLVGVAFGLVTWTWTRRCQVLKTMELARHFHCVAHWLRDESDKLRTALFDAEANNDYGKYDVMYQCFNDEIANRIARYFEELTGERTACSSIRLASADENNNINFKTVARSNEMWKDKREKQTVDIPEAKGVARMLRQKDRYGVLFVWDIEAVREDADIWVKSPTDEYPDVKYVMVAPINGYDLEERKALGLLYATTKKKKLRVEYSEHLMAFADLLGLLYPVVTRSEEGFQWSSA